MKHTLLKELKQSDIFSHMSSMGYLPRWCVLLLDLMLCSLGYWLSIWIGTSLFHYHPTGLMISTAGQYGILIAVQAGCFWLFHTYSGILRYSTFVDTLKVLSSVVVCSMGLMITNIIWQLCTGDKPFMNTALLLYILVSFILLFCERVGVKTLYESIRQATTSGPKVLIYGTKSAGIAIGKMLIASGNTPYHPVGFIDDKREERKYKLLGMRVHMLDEDLFERMRSNHIEHVIISPLKMKELNPAKDLTVFLEHGIKILTTPYFTTYSEDSSKSAIGRIDAIRIEDLLERDTIRISTENVSRILTDKVVLVSGAAGSIGQEIVRQVLKYQPRAMVLLEQGESPLHDLTLDLKEMYPEAVLIPCIGNIRERERVEEVFREFRPDVVYHAAAYKHVPLMEDHPNEAIHANVLGTKNMADMAVKYGTERFVMISTDKAVNPTNVMGASKRIAEMYVQALNKETAGTSFITTRFGNVLGSNGSVIPYFKKQIQKGGPVTVTHPDIIRYFMTIPEACTLVLEASVLGNGGEIFVFDMGQPVKILHLAQNMIRLAGYTPDVDIPIVFTGLRPGEKLYEELLNQKETTLPTEHEKIMIARVREYAFAEVSQGIDELIAMSYEGKPFETVRKMKELVPEFKSMNSVYQKLDETRGKA